MLVFFEFVEKTTIKSLEGRFRTKIQTSIDGTEITVKTDTGQIINTLKLHFGTIVSDREEKPKRYGHNQRFDHTEKSTLRARQKIQSMV